MTTLKPGWTCHKFGDMVSSMGATRKARGWRPSESGVDRYIGLEHLDSHSLTIRRWGSPDEVGENSDLRHFEPGDVILARRGIELRKVGMAAFRGVASGHALVFRAKRAVVLPEFLPFFMQSDAFMQRADRFSVGSLSRTVNLTALTREEFALPPLQEQRRIAAMLHAALTASDSLRTALVAGESARHSLIKQTFSRGVRSESLRDSAIGLIPRSWTVEPLGRRFGVQLGKMMSESARSGGQQTAYLRNANVQWNRLDLEDVATMSFSDEEKAKFSLRAGDILACEGRHVGKSAIWRNEIPGACYQKALHRLRVIGDDAPEFMLHYLNFCSITGKFAALTGETTIPHLPAEKLRSMLVGFPSLDEQREIAHVVESYDMRLALLRNRGATLTDLVDAMEVATL